MDTYDPLTAPDPDAWLALDEGERLYLVEAYHEDEELENPTLHAAMHTAVENQLALKDEPVLRTVERLLRGGLDRHDAVHAIASVFAEHLFGVMKTRKSVSNDKYYRALGKLTAKSWRASG